MTLLPRQFKEGIQSIIEIDCIDLAVLQPDGIVCGKSRCMFWDAVSHQDLADPATEALFIVWATIDTGHEQPQCWFLTDLIRWYPAICRKNVDNVPRIQAQQEGDIIADHWSRVALTTADLTHLKTEADIFASVNLL